MLQNINFVVGTGGIGKGILFKLNGNENLGRNESRLAELTNYKDYCKLHIILNYVAAFLNGEITSYAVSAVGADDVGKDLKETMSKTGINVDYVEESDDLKTLFAVCYQFPTGEGGNISTSNSACNNLSSESISNFFDKNKDLKHGLVLAAPEVPVSARQKLLEHGRQRDCFNIASFLTEEAQEFAHKKIFKLIDLVAINVDEANAIAKVANLQGEINPTKIYEYLKTFNENIILIVTLGKKGAVTLYKDNIINTPIIDNEVINTAGAGDCFLGTLIASIIKGVPLISTEENCLSTAQDIATLASAIKVSCNDTIDFSLNKQKMLDFAKQNNINFSKLILNNFFSHN